MRPRASILWALVAALLHSLPLAAASDLEWRWRRVATPSRGEALRGLAVDLREGRMAVGDPSGVSLGTLGEGLLRVARVEGVSDLAFGGDGALWIGSEKGLWRLSRRGRLEERIPRPGEAARAVRRIASGAGILVVASDGGAFLSRDGETWHAPGGVLSTAAVQAAAVGGEPGGPEVWLAAGADLWQVTVSFEDGRIRSRARRLDAIPDRPTAEAPVDLAVGLPGARLAVLYPKHLATLRPATGGAGGVLDRKIPSRSHAAARSERWKLSRLPLPPGASALRIAFAAGRFWLAHDRGLMQAESPAGPWRRSASPAGRAPTVSVAQAGVRPDLPTVLAATALGLLEGRGEAQPELASGAPLSSPPSEPGIHAVQRAALRHQGLGPERMRSLRRGLRWRGMLPILSLRFSVEDVRDRGTEYDEAFVSGDMRFLHDWDRNRGRDYEGSATLTWDFGDAVFAPDSIDLSREERQVIALRDDMLDEINQLYFERRRLMLVLAALAGPTDPEAARLRLRVAELSAALDAWTGGWFSRAVRPAGR
jgi:hypothetical protein